MHAAVSIGEVGRAGDVMSWGGEGETQQVGVGRVLGDRTGVERWQRLVL